MSELPDIPNLNRFGAAYLKHLSENRPELMQELEADGILSEHVLRKQNRAGRQFVNLVTKGTQAMQAEELVMSELLSLPTL